MGGSVEQNVTDTASQDVEIVTFGCRLNTYESEVMRGHAHAAGLKDTVIFNSCAVTANAEREAVQAIRRMRRARPDAKIIVTGCAAQITPDKFAELVEVDHVLGNDEKLKAETFAQLSDVKTQVADIQQIHRTEGLLAEQDGVGLRGGFDGRARAFLQVQNGCDHRCTFCIIPYGRGPSRSVPVATIVAEAQKLVANGYKEIVLTGVDVTSYGADLEGTPSLGKAIRTMLAQVPSLSRVRLSSLDPVEVDDDLWWLIEHEPRLMPHLHISLQAGDDMILKRMKRRHTRQDAIDFCHRARALRPNMTFGADIIAGFPTETDEMSANTLALIDACDLTWLHIFPYSAREGTPAAKMPQLPLVIRKERAAILRTRGAEKVHDFLIRFIGKEVDVLTENKGNVGHTPGFAVARFSAPTPPNTLIRARVVGVVDEMLEVVAC